MLIGTLTEGDRTLEVRDDDRSGYCASGNCGRCAHRPGGAHDGGIPVAAVPGVPAHVWRCGCPCHPSAAPAALFDLGAAS